MPSSARLFYLTCPLPMAQEDQESISQWCSEDIPSMQCSSFTQRGIHDASPPLYAYRPPTAKRFSDISSLLGRMLDRLDIVCRHTLRRTSFLYFDPSVSLIFPDQYKPLALLHAMFGIALSGVLVQCFDEFKFLRASPRCHCRALLHATGRGYRRCRCAADRRAAVGVC